MRRGKTRTLVVIVNHLSLEIAAVATTFAFLVPRALAEPPESILGTYQRQSVTCGGGPGFADRSGPAECKSVFEDRLVIAPSLKLDPGTSPDTLFVEFGLHFGYSDYCAFRGHGTWSTGKIILKETEKPLPSSCRLQVNLMKDGVRLRDVRKSCAVLLCTAPQKLDGVTYRKVLTR
jgi:hypothetical protein